jgi:hypothetical protein
MQRPTTSEIEQVVDLLENGIQDEPEQGDADTPVPEPQSEGPQDGENTEPVAADTGQQTEGEGDNEPAPAEKLDLKGLANRLEIDVKELYGLEIPMPGEGESITLGELKDQAHEFSTVKQRQEKLEDERISHQNDVLRSRQELSALVNLLPEIPQELQQQAGAMQQQHLQQEQARLLEVLPEWRDANTFAADREIISNTVAEYGFNDADMSAVTDHRLIKLLHDYGKLRQRMAQAQETAQRVDKSPKKPAKAVKVNKASDLEKRAKAGDQQAAIQLVSELIGPAR